MKYYEPCVGQKDLVDQLGFIDCVGSSDIEKDALTLTVDDLNEADMIITNPPWTRSILHPMINHFSSMKPTWLLFDSDWSHTKQSSVYMKELCTDIVSVGRLVWIPGTKVSGKDNCSWYRFDKDKSDDTRFHGR
jgi:hypothetical protein